MMPSVLRRSGSSGGLTVCVAPNAAALQLPDMGMTKLSLLDRGTVARAVTVTLTISVTPSLRDTTGAPNLDGVPLPDGLKPIEPTNRG